jgi:hypothetical protein
MNDKLIKLAEKELNKAIVLLRDTQYMWDNYTDLKLHDASYCDIDFEGYYGAKVTFDTEAHSDWFNMFCEDSYSQFIEDLRNDYIDFEEFIDRVGRTSSFYIGHLHGGLDLLEVLLSEDVTDFYCDCHATEFIMDMDTNKVKISQYEDYAEEFEEDLLYIIDKAVELTEETLKPIKTVYNYINDFKRNQVEYFQDYVKETFIANC